MKRLNPIIAIILIISAIACTERNPMTGGPENDSLPCFSLKKAADGIQTIEGSFVVRMQPSHSDQPNGDCGGSDFHSVSLAGEGYSNITDAAKISLDHCAEIAANADNPSVYNIVTGSLELVDGTGSRIAATYQGEHVIATRDTLRGTFIVTEGSGDFAGMQGEGCFRAIGTGNFGEFAMELRGEM